MSSIVEKLLLDKSVLWFKGKGTPKSTNSDVKSGWVTKAAMAIAVLVFVAYLAYKANKRARAIAKAKHGRDVAVEDLTQAKKKWELSKIDEDIEEAMESVKTANEEAARLILKADKLDVEHEYERFKIEAIENWDDMDRYLDSIR